ncbi:MAG: UDP-N-acetylglucosamine 2-epimerase (non-hydrolyzing) [Bdellovibrionaceae bacterium]|nr:UDP-N-acetylglucosamine 2-epimerase (non-hydrolyzing) [Bdellovibrionales bacterium]MCB9253724.1 UDP-N-acetylglucosamine 2-epimerase (non-hydrolyzing) [Pseudobdellovibrionaceae bacterium]
MKIARLREVAKDAARFDLHITHTGQHFDQNMAKIFFEQFGIQPDTVLDAGTGTAAVQLAKMIQALSDHFCCLSPNLVIAVGDVNSALAAALVANKMGIDLAHLESGLRSSDRSMPEEINRIIVDELSNICFVTEPSGQQNLLQTGKHIGQIHLIGNTMIDTLVAMESKVTQSTVLRDLKLPKDFALVTAHRPALVDLKSGLEFLCEMLEITSKYYHVCFPMHPRTYKNLHHFGLLEKLERNERVLLTEPLDYLRFQRIVKSARVILTDSGGLQEEAAYRKQPCLTFRQNTERPVTVELGTNTLIGFDLALLEKELSRIQSGCYKPGQDIPLWDGAATERIVRIINDFFEKRTGDTHA